MRNKAEANLHLRSGSSLLALPHVGLCCPVLLGEGGVRMGTGLECPGNDGRGRLWGVHGVYWLVAQLSSLLEWSLPSPVLLSHLMTCSLSSKVMLMLVPFSSF